MTSVARLLPLEGGHNFRDLGGYEAEDGRTVKWGKVFRSGVMTHLTEADLAALDGMGLRVVCDFRSMGERRSEPWRGGPHITYIAWDYENSTGALHQLFVGLVSAERTKTMMMSLYERIAYDHADKYRVMFDRLIDGDTPLVFNCSAGKDRTGTAAALLLSALGVPKDAILEDYALTEKLVDEDKYLVRKATLDAKQQSLWTFFAKLPADVRRPLVRSDPDYLNALLTTLTARHGSVLAFLKSELGLDDARLARLRDHLLE